MIRAVFRVQCDGPCRGWLSWSEDYVPGTDILPRHEVVALTAERAFNWPGERAARLAAQRAGWRQMSPGSNGLWRCPTCAANPLDIPPFLRQVVKRFIITGEERHGDAPYYTTDTSEDAYDSEEVRAAVERMCRHSFHSQFPGWPIASEKWTEYAIPSDLERDR